VKQRLGSHPDGIETSMNVIEADGLGKRYGRKWALRNCTLSVPAGCVTRLVGPNGAGKTTLVSLAVGLIRPTAGPVRVAGERAGSRAARDILSRLRESARSHTREVAA
jgi:ABC-2 type transport system ATP-binding protein